MGNRSSLFKPGFKKLAKFDTTRLSCIRLNASRNESDIFIYIMIILNIFICNVFILYRDYIFNLLNYVIFYLIILNWFTKLFSYGIEIIFINIKYIYMVNFIWYRYYIFNLCFYLIILKN